MNLMNCTGLVFLTCFAILISLVSCSDSNKNADIIIDDTGDTGTGTSDSDTDTDEGSEGTSDSDADADGDGDADSDADTDSDGDTDSDADTDTDGDADTDADTDSDSDTDADAGLDGGILDGGDDTDPDTDTEPGDCFFINYDWNTGFQNWDSSSKWILNSEETSSANDCPDLWPEEVDYLSYCWMPGAGPSPSTLTSPNLNMAGCSTLNANFDFFYTDRPENGGVKLYLDCRKDNVWIENYWMFSETSGALGPQRITGISMDDCLGSDYPVKIRFRLEFNQSWAMGRFGLDNFTLSAFSK